MKYERFKVLENYILAHPEKKDSVTLSELAEYQKEHASFFASQQKYQTFLLEKEYHFK